MPSTGLPRDPAQWIALVLAVLAVAAARPLLRGSRPRIFAAACATAAAALSAAYVAVYLRGGPRIIDATSYFLEARAMSEGLFAFPLDAPESAVLGRFFVRSVHAGVPHAAVIFPPGYPAVLALGFLARAPMAVGPLIAAAIAIVTFDLAGHLARDVGAPAAPIIARVAALLSVVCAALRYHTADTMSHGLAALCFAAAITLLFRAEDAREPRRTLVLAVGAGIAAGWLFATRPVSALALAAVIAFVLLRSASARRAAPRLAIALAIGALPGAALFVAHQHAATGTWLLSSQRLYYAVSDGPPGCFRYGFGAGIGCVGEHGDFVRDRLADGYGVVAALGTTLRRLRMHAVDLANAEPLVLLVPVGAFIARASVRGRAFAIALVALIAAYAPFYFDGNYPGGGGRFFCDVLPIEHAFAALAVVSFAARRRDPERWAAGAVALALVGFAFRAGFDHAALRDREGGRPFFEAEEVARAGVTRGLLFVDTDHGFDLAYDPRAAETAVARFHGDAIDRFAWEARGRPPAYRYRFEVPRVGGRASVVVEPLVFAPIAPAGAIVIEGESLWPAIAQENAWALPEWAAGSCASADRWLAVHRAGDRERSSITLALPAKWLAGRTVSPRVTLADGARGELVIEGNRVSFEVPNGSGITCLDLPSVSVPADARDVELEVRVVSDSPRSWVALDALRVSDPR